MLNAKRDKKEVIAYLHTHWDREWYREYEVFRLRLVRVFDQVLEMLENREIPSFYFDGQVAALQDYLELRPEKEVLVKMLIADKRLFVGPFYCLVDEFLTDGTCFRKNLEIGMQIARNYGCKDFIAYLADTFGHSQNIPEILKEYGIDKAVVWRGCSDKIPANFKFGGINTVNLVRGYFNDIFSTDKTIEEKAEFLKHNLDLIAEKSGNTLLMPIGADHLGVPADIMEQIEAVNEILEDYTITVGSLFDYFEKVKFKENINTELRDNSKTFTLQGVYSSRSKLKRLNTECSYKLELADKLQYNFGANYDSAVDYAYRLLLQNQAHDSICGCSTDMVHEENIVRYNKILQIADTIINEISMTQPENLSMSFKYPDKYKILEIQRTKIEENVQIIEKKKGFPRDLLYDINKIPVTEDYTTIYTMLKEFNPDNRQPDLIVKSTNLFNLNINLSVEDGKLVLYDKAKRYDNFIEFVRCKDYGDSYNFGPVKDDVEEIAEIKSSKVLEEGPFRSTLRIMTSFFTVDVSLYKKSKLLRFKIKWLNLSSNKRWQVRFNFPNKVKEVKSEDMNMLITRKFDPDYDIRENLPTEKGKEAKTNTAPFQRFVWVNGLGIVTKGINEYEVKDNHFALTLLRSTGMISNPKNPARTTPAGPPIEVPGLQQLGENEVEFAIGFIPVNDWANYVEEIYPQTILF